MAGGNNQVLILGGAGFIGSNLARRFVEAGRRVTVVDGFLPRTRASLKNLEGFRDRIRLIESRIEEVAGLESLVESSDLIIDCMAWTAHLLALRDPVFDLELNARSHLALLQAMKPGARPLLVYLGSRGQYGVPRDSVITEQTPLEPTDVQGIHKTAGEAYFRVFAKMHGLNAVSLRIPNCYGPNQPVSGPDIGLVGGFIRDLLAGKDLEVYGSLRRRNLLYVEDLCDVVLRLAEKPLSGFEAYNFGGRELEIAELTRTLVDIVGRGAVRQMELPDEVRKIDFGSVPFNDAKLGLLLGELPRHDLRSALANTVRYFKENSA